ncbi:hypothetical protein SLA2020_467430 [Shorea laevis]
MMALSPSSQVTTATYGAHPPPPGLGFDPAPCQLVKKKALPMMDSYYFLILYCLAEDDAVSNSNYAPSRANSGLKPGHPPIYWRNDVVSTEDYGPTGPNPKHQPPPPPRQH